MFVTRDDKAKYGHQHYLEDLVLDCKSFHFQENNKELNEAFNSSVKALYPLVPMWRLFDVNIFVFNR